MKTLKDYFSEAEFAANHPVAGDVLDIIINEELVIECAVTELGHKGIMLSLDETAVSILEQVELYENFAPMAPADSDSPLTHTTHDEKLEEGREEVDKWAQKMFDEIEERHGWAVAEQFEDIYYAKDVEQIEDAHLNVNALNLILKTLKSVGPRDDYAEDWQRLVGLIEEYLGPKDVDEAKYHGKEVKLGKPMQGDVKKFKVYVKDPKTGKVKKVNFGKVGMEIKRDNPTRRKSYRARHNCANPGPRTKANYWSCRMWSKKPVSKIIKGK
jgi:hypothetical protein